MATLLKKISPKNLLGDVKKTVQDVDAAQFTAYKIYGIANGIETGTGIDDKPWYKFKGQFGAVNVVTGEEFSSPATFLPDPFEGMLLGALENSETVEFGVEVDIKQNDTPIGYEYVVRPIIKAETADPLQHLKDKMGLQLEAPKTKGKAK